MFQKMLEKKRNGEGGFTLIEPLVVMVIIGLLAAIAIPLFLSQKGQARETALKNDLRNLATYAETYAVGNNGAYTGWTIADAQAGGFQHSDTLAVAERAGLGTATATAFCVGGTANGQAWSFDSDRTPQLDDVVC
jgi:type IV pilus assembly protein PilA